MPHKKPTQKELDEGIEKAKKLENEPTPSKPIPSEPKPTPSEPIPKPTPSEPPTEPKPTPSEPPTEPTPSEPAPSPDYKKKFIESQREASILNAKNKNINEALEKAKTLPDPTDKEMTSEFPDWEMMSDTEKKLAIDNNKNKKALELLGDVTKESKKIDDWNKKVDVFINDARTLTNNPELEGKITDFKIFALKPTRRNMDFPDLISAFLFDASKNVQKNKGKMFERGSGGPNVKEKPKSDKISVSEADRLRQTDYKKYIKYVKAGKIDTSEIE